MPKILLVEDDSSIRSLVALNLRKEGYEVLETASGEEAMQALLRENNFDAAILDVMLPGISGIDVLNHIREAGNMMGVMMLTSKSQEIDKVEALEVGADDYVLKPFSIVEFLARLKALLRRMQVNTDKYTEELITSGPFSINISKRECYKNYNKITLTPTEFMILRFFIEKKGVVVNRQEILDEIWGDNFFGDVKIVDVNVRRLRRKIESNPSSPMYIETVWGKGYRWMLS